MIGFFSSLWDSISGCYNTSIDTSYDVKTLYSGNILSSEMKLHYMLCGTKIKSTIGLHNDHYDYVEDVVYLTFDTLQKESAIADATACHEVGHVIAYKNGFRVKGLEAEKEATRLALEFLRKKLDDKEYAVAERFLNEMLKSYKI